MNYEVINGARLPIKAWTRGVQVEDAARDQLLNLAGMPFIHKHVAAMPDVHWGMGATVGSVIATKGAVIPAAVGVDIGCGMMAVRTTLTAAQLPDNLAALRTEIEARIPHGRTDNGGNNDRGAYHSIRSTGINMFTDLAAPGLARITQKYPALSKAAERADRHFGTLGTGNHFIELCLDEDQRVWVMLHSGSRGIGNAIGTLFINLAKKDMQRWFINLPDADLAYIPEGSTLFDDYIEAVQWAQNYAALNRRAMMEDVLAALAVCGLPYFTVDASAINCHHNYVTRERHFGEDVLLTRKGAVDASEGKLGIIPGSMGAKSFIVRGKGNRESFCSCSHGAGRKMSRAEAKRQFTIDDHMLATAGVECRKDAEVIDETPAAYKDIDAVMAAQSDLVEIVHTLKQVLCVKG